MVALALTCFPEILHLLDLDRQKAIGKDEEAYNCNHNVELAHIKRRHGVCGAPPVQAEERPGVV
jgi:hypothetical protein